MCIRDSCDHGDFSYQANPYYEESYHTSQDLDYAFSPGPAPAPSPAPGASASLQDALHLLMAQSVPQGESDPDSVFGSVGIAGMALAGQGVVCSAENRIIGPPGSELWVSDIGATNHITSDPTNVYDCVDIPPCKEKVFNSKRKGGEGTRGK